MDCARTRTDNEMGNVQNYVILHGGENKIIGI